MKYRYGLDKIQHEKMLEGIKTRLESNGFVVQADHIKSPNGVPARIGTATPDLWAKKGSKEIVVEVETCNSLDDPDTRYQFNAFSRKGGVEFWVVVPKKCAALAQMNAKKWGYKIDKWIGAKVDD